MHPNQYYCRSPTKPIADSPEFKFIMPYTFGMYKSGQEDWELLSSSSRKLTYTAYIN